MRASSCQNCAKPTILFEHADDKSRQWGKALASIGYEVVSYSGSQARTGSFLIKSIIHGEKPIAVVFRYLNDYRSLSKTLLRFISEITALLVCRITGTTIIWICHNVDRESKRFHPTLSDLRRKMFAKAAYRIFVMDEGLVQAARIAFPDQSAKIDFLTFGTPTIKAVSERTKDVFEEVVEFISRRRASADQSGRPFFCFSCIGRAGDKYEHFPMARDLVRKMEGLGYAVAGIVIGPFKDIERDGSQEPFFGLDREPSIFFRSRYIPLDEVDLLEHIDFILRGYLDWSMSYTLYKAAAFRKPVLALDTGFVGWAVKNYKLGAVLSRDLSNIEEALAALRTWDPSNAQLFLSTHSWEFAARKIVDAVSLKNR